MNSLEARILWGSNNIYRIQTAFGEQEARLKGKKLDTTAAVHNPLAPGDRVAVDADGLISKRLQRSSEISRWNRKNRALQTIAANVDLVAVVASCGVPPFRPRFIDRALVLCLYTGLPCLIIVNKADLGLEDWEAERIRHYQSLGIDVCLVSALTGEAIDFLSRKFQAKSAVLFGQSGAGKSSILNCLIPGLDTKTGEVSEKFERGRHTTTLARAYSFGSGGLIIDTPGIRELDISFIPSDQVKFYFPEFALLQNECRIPNCSHDHEPGCVISEALEGGLIHEDRYTSYLSLYYESFYTERKNAETGKEK